MPIKYPLIMCALSVILVIDEKENSGSNFGEKSPGLGKILYVQLVKMLNKKAKWDKTAEYIYPSPDPAPDNKNTHA